MAKLIIGIFFLMISTSFCSQESINIKHITSRQNALQKIPNGNLTDYKLQELKKLLTESEKYKFSQGKVDALLNLVLTNYYAKKNFDQIIFQTDLIEKISSENEDFYSQSIAKSMRGGVFLYVGLVNDGKKELDEAQNLTEKISENDLKHLAKNYYFKIYSEYFNDMNEYGRVVSLSKKRENELLFLDDLSTVKKYLLVETYNMLCSAYLKLGENKNAEKYLKIQEFYFKNNQDLYNLAYFKNNKADFLTNSMSGKNETDLMYKIYKDVESTAIESQNESVLALIYPKIAALCKRQNDLENQIQYLNKSIKLNDDLDTARYIMLDRIAKINKPKKSDSLTNFMLLSLLLGLLIGVLIYCFRSKKKKTETQDCEESISYAELLNLALHSNHSFYINFLKKFPDFNTKLLLKNPTMKNSDLEFAALIKIGLNDQQIAEVKKLSMKAVTSKKYRIRKKLDLSEETFLFLQNF
ncbi:hypothetical protein ASG31_10345 [Chryseobacterium sp. Leaf404]|uniref:helix-turn-helix transcriptional regulator n=1 Tax=unclassified Chryseobacterium TaxID=2593645 RepID=UPI0006FB94EC|nr:MULTISPECIES: hypothetical protein [unclassified Chryseobacterium]KQT16770.1 hypothetical protein ASG31_10345 [Chryseobacterium sp. Leaf404]